MAKREFFEKALQAARDGGHIWPEFAACEAALESGWGTSKLAREANNLFGQKQASQTSFYPTIDIPTHENVDLNKDGVVDENEVVTLKHSYWPIFPDWATSFRERMALLRRAANKHPDYKAALNAEAGEDFVRAVSRTWATDPKRADKVMATYVVNEALIMQILGVGL